MAESGPKNVFTVEEERGKKAKVNMPLLYCGHAHYHHHPHCHGAEQVARQVAPPPPALAALAASVQAQQDDNVALEALLLDLRPTPLLPPKQPPRTARHHPPVVVAPALPPQVARRRVGKGEFTFSFGEAYTKWRQRLAAQGIVAPVSALTRYWAQWGAHSVALPFFRLTVYAKLKRLGRKARLHRPFFRWRCRHAVVCHVRAWAHVSKVLRYARASSRRRVWRGLVLACQEAKRRRQLLAKVIMQMRYKLQRIAITEWQRGVATVQRHRQHSRRAASYAAQAVLTIALQSWAQLVPNVLAGRHYLNTCFTRWVRWCRAQTTLRKVASYRLHVSWQYAKAVLRTWRVQTNQMRHRRRTLSKLRRNVAARSIQRCWHKMIEQRRLAMLARALARMRNRQLATAWHSWETIVWERRANTALLGRLVSKWSTWAKLQRQLRHNFVARWLQRLLNKSVAQWRRVWEQSRALLRQSVLVFVHASLAAAWAAWIDAVEHNVRITLAWHEISQMCISSWRVTVARTVARARAHAASALVIQAWTRGYRARVQLLAEKLRQQNFAATILQQLSRVWLARLQPEPQQEDGAPPQELECEPVPEPEPAPEPEPEPELEPEPAKLQRQSLVSATARSPDQLLLLMRRVDELRMMLSQMQSGSRLHVYNAAESTRVPASVWVELQARQLRWETYSDDVSGSQRHATGGGGRVCHEVVWPFERLRRVCWGSGGARAGSLSVDDESAQLCFSVESVDGQWLDFAAPDATVLRSWLLGLQSLVTKPGQTLVNAGQLDNLLQKSGLHNECTLSSKFKVANESVSGDATAATAPRQQDNGNPLTVVDCLKELFDAAIPSGRIHADAADVTALLQLIDSELKTRSFLKYATRQDERSLVWLRRGLAQAKQRHISFPATVALLTADDDAEWAQLFCSMTPHLSTASGRAVWDDDVKSLSAIGLRLGEAIEIRMPVMSAGTRRWLWRQATVVRKAPGRYFDAEAEKVRGLVSKLARGIGPDGKVPSSLQACQAYLDKYQPKPGWHSKPPSSMASVGGQPIWELLLEDRQPPQTGFVRCAGVQDRPEFKSVCLQGAFIPTLQNAGGDVSQLHGRGVGGGQLWLRTASRNQFSQPYGPVQMNVSLMADAARPEKWMAKPCWVSVAGSTLIVREKKGASERPVFAEDVGRCTLSEAPNDSLALMGPPVRRRYPLASANVALVFGPVEDVTIAKEYITSAGETVSKEYSVTESGGRNWVPNEGQEAGVADSLRNAISSVQRETYEWRTRDSNIVRLIT